MLPAHASEHSGDRSGQAEPWTQRIAWTSQRVAAGLTVRSGVLDGHSAPFWTVTVQARTTSSITGLPALAELGTPSWAQDVARKLAANGYPARQDRIPWPNYTDAPHGLEGVRVRTGRYASRDEAQTAVVRLHAIGFSSATAEWTGYDHDTAPDAEQIHEAILDPRQFPGIVEATHNGTLARRQTTSSAAAELRAAVAVNGGFFITSDSDGFSGAPAGLAAYRGRLESMSVGDRAALVLGAGPARIAQLVSSVTISSGTAAHPVEGINRKPGLLRNCGRPDAAPSTEPRQDVTCTSNDEVVLFTDALGASTPTGAGTQAVLGADGVVVATGARGGPVPAGGVVVQAIGSSATWLNAHAKVGTRLTVSRRVTDTTRHPLPLTGDASIASAAPLLLAHATPAIDAVTEGLAIPSDLSFNYAWAQIRQPRTMAGIDGRGRLLLVTVDGRRPTVSEGVTISEGAALMSSLGAVTALNLDGGGSSAMAVNGTLVNHPSDATGERADGDFIAAVPRRSPQRRALRETP